MSSAAVVIGALRVKKGGKTENGRAVSFKSVPIHLQTWARLFKTNDVVSQRFVKF